MKKILVLCAITLVAVTMVVWWAVAKPNRFGTFTSAPKADVVRLIADPKSFLGKTVEIEGTVADQCTAMGCYFFFRAGKDILRVDLQEVAMKAPMMNGRAARVEGQMVPYNGGYQFYASAVEFE
jgi:hypothetical protein